MATITTERQALVAIATQLNDLVAAMSASGTFEAAIAIQAGALVNEGESSYRQGDIGSMSLTPRGRLRVTTDEEQVCWATENPWGAAPWGGFSG